MKQSLIKACVVSVILALAVGAIVLRYTPSESARREWKDKAVADISARVSDPAWLKRELDHLRARGADDPGHSHAWLSEGLIVMRNGDWIAYANICQKQDNRIRDLFVGRGSDGNWHYSTYHFCKGMIVLGIAEQSDDLAAFSETYFLRRFDRHSDEALQATWPPDSK